MAYTCSQCTKEFREVIVDLNHPNKVKVCKNCYYQNKIGNNIQTNKKVV